MKRMVICLSVLMICFYFSFSFAKEPKLSQKSIEEIVNKIARPFFVALKNGDIKTLKKLITKDMYEEKKVLFEQNKEYPNFLRSHYRDADFIIVSANETGNNILVNTVITYSDGWQKQTTLYLVEKHPSQGIWKISRKPGPK